MGRRKSNKAKQKEGRGKGIGSDYIAYHKANETCSIGKASMVFDPVENRLHHFLSDTERMAYDLLRWDPNVEYIREHYPLDNELINEVREQAGYGKVPPEAVFTTDLFVDYQDGHQEAFSIKADARDFDPQNPKYLREPNKYSQLMIRQDTERRYWESQHVKFNIWTGDYLMQWYTRIINIRFVAPYWCQWRIQTRQERLLYLIAHRIINVDMDSDILNVQELVDNCRFDIDEKYKSAIKYEKESKG